MTTAISLQHDEWHQVNGKYRDCPLDCGIGDQVAEVFLADDQELQASGERGIFCGSCKQRHLAKEVVRFCFEVKYDEEALARREAEMAKEIEEAGDCEHGLSAALCAGPGHYPADY